MSCKEGELSTDGLFEVQQETVQALRDFGGEITSSDLSILYDVKLSTASMRLRRLFLIGVLGRELERREAGKTYRYYLRS
jgi:hypothetical protein